MRILWYQSVCICGCLYYSPSSLYSKISPGWQFSSLQIASRVEKRMAFAFPVFNMERLAGVRSIFSAKSPSEIFRLAIITSKFTIIGIDQFILGLFGFSSTARTCHYPIRLLSLLEKLFSIVLLIIVNVFRLQTGKGIS